MESSHVAVKLINLRYKAQSLSEIRKNLIRIKI